MTNEELKSALSSSLLRDSFYQSIVNVLSTQGQGQPGEVADTVASSVVNDNPGVDDMSDLEELCVKQCFATLGYVPVNN